MVETARLLITPLTREQLLLYLQANDLYEQAAGLTCNGRIVVPAVQQLVTRFTLPRIAEAPGDDYLYYTFWIVIEKATKLIVAELGFKGAPNEEGAIEIGYGTMPASQRKGYMTEAVGGMLRWGSERPGVRCILAETDETNAPSIKVLQRNHFTQYTQKGNMLWWRYACSAP